MAFDAFNPVWFSPTPYPVWNPAPSPSAVNQQAVVNADNLSAGLVHPNNAIFVPPPVQPQPIPSSSGGSSLFNALVLFAQTHGITAYPPGFVPAPPTSTYDPNTGSIVMPAPRPSNPPTFGPPSGPPAFTPDTSSQAYQAFKYW